MAATDRRIAKPMIIPNWAFIRRESRAAVAAFYAPFSELREAWNAYRGTKRNANERLSPVAEGTLEVSAQSVSISGARYSLSPSIGLREAPSNPTAAPNPRLPATIGGKSAALRLAEDIQRVPFAISAITGGAAAAMVLGAHALVRRNAAAGSLHAAATAAIAASHAAAVAAIEAALKEAEADSNISPADETGGQPS